MDGSSSIKPLAEVNLTERELRHLAAAWLSCSTKDNIDFDMFTILAGHPNSANARKRFGEIKKRVREQVFGDGDGNPISVPSTPRKRKTNGNGDSTSPTKKTKAGKKKAEDSGELDGSVKNEPIEA